MPTRQPDPDEWHRFVPCQGDGAPILDVRLPSGGMVAEVRALDAPTDIGFVPCAKLTSSGVQHVLGVFAALADELRRREAGG